MRITSPDDYKVYLDGKLQTGVVEADDVNGYVIIATNATGTGQYGGLTQLTYRGYVEIRTDSDEKLARIDTILASEDLWNETKLAQIYAVIHGGFKK